VPDRTIGVTLTLAFDDADSGAIGRTAAEDFGVELEADAALADVIAAIVRNTLDAQFLGFGLGITVVDVKADETDG